MQEFIEFGELINDIVWHSTIRLIITAVIETYALVERKPDLA